MTGVRGFETSFGLRSFSHGAAYSRIWELRHRQTLSGNTVDDPWQEYDKMVSQQRLYVSVR